MKMNNCPAQSGPHNKVYEKSLLTSCPPQQRWVCRQCGSKGVDVLPLTEEGESYEAINARFDGEALISERARMDRMKILKGVSLTGTRFHNS